MVEKCVVEWFFLFVFFKEDELFWLYVCFVVVVLVINKEVECEVECLGMLVFVELFVVLLDFGCFVCCLVDVSDIS